MSELGDIEKHWLTGARFCRSPNFDDRPDCEVDTIVIHNISLPPGEFGGGHIDELFCNNLDPQFHPYFAQIRHLEVSSHLLIDRQGKVTQFVGFDRRAWHAGQSCFRGRERFNDFSIGIELEGTDDFSYEAEQYSRLGQIIVLLQQTYPAIIEENIVGHSAISPGRKTDPGPAFEWPRLFSLLAGNGQSQS